VWVVAGSDGLNGSGLVKVWPAVFPLRQMLVKLCQRPWPVGQLRRLIVVVANVDVFIFGRRAKRIVLCGAASHFVANGAALPKQAVDVLQWWSFKRLKR